MSNKKRFKTIDEYIATFPDDIQKILEKIRITIKEAAPGAEEAISYQIPVFNLNGRYLIYFAGWKHHIGMYPINAAIKKVFKDELAPYKQAKGTVQFPLDKPIPFKLIAKIVMYKVREHKEMYEES